LTNPRRPHESSYLSAWPAGDFAGWLRIVPAKAIAAEVKPGNVKTVNGANVALARTANFVTVEEALVTGADKSATNGVVHVIDRVLLPPRKN